LRRSTPSPLVPIAIWSLVVALTVAAVRRPRALPALVALAFVLPFRMLGAVLTHRRALRRRRRTLSRHSARAARPRSVYDELWS
jgi:hypothetical protein